MSQTSYSIVTQAGRNAEALAKANGTALTFSEIALGDGTRNPVGVETALENEVERKPIVATGVIDGAEDHAFFDIFLEAEDGPYTVREMGLFLDDGTLYAVSKVDPAFPKTTPASGQPSEHTLRMVVIISDIENVVIEIVSGGMVYVPVERRIDTEEGITGGGDLTINRTHKLAINDLQPIAEAIDPTDDDLVLWDDSANAHRKFAPAALRSPLGIAHAITAAGLTNDGEKQDQPAQAIARHASGAIWALGGGTANAQTATASGTFAVPDVLFDGMRLTLQPGVSNTGPTTLNAFGLGAKSVIRYQGSPLTGGEIKGGRPIDLIYRASADAWIIAPWAWWQWWGEGNLDSLISNTAQSPSETSLDLVQQAIARLAAGGSYWGYGAGTANAQTVVPNGSFPVPSMLYFGIHAEFIPAVTNTGPANVDVFSLGPEPVVRHDRAALTGGELTAGRPVQMVWTPPGEWRLQPWAVETPPGSGGSQSWTSPATTSFTVPADVTAILCTLLGGGGGGGRDAGSGATGGGAGAFAQGWFRVLPGQVLTITVAVGGPGAVNPGQGGTGGTSSVGTLISAPGGTGGSSDGVSGGGSPAGVGGQLNVRGGGGSSPDIYGSAKFGGMGGVGYAGGAGQGVQSSAPGGGGAGGTNGGSGVPGGRGFVNIRW